VVPPAVDALSEPLQAAYRRAWQVVVDEEAVLQAHPELLRRRTRLVAMRTRIEAEMARVDAEAKAWIESHMPPVYEVGASAAIGLAGAGEFRWTAIHRTAVQQLAADLFDDLLKATRHVRRTTKTLVRVVARDQALQRAITGLDTTTSAARRMTVLLEENGIHAVRYANGARHGLREYADMALRTKTSTAYNLGSLNSVETAWWECLDGPACGLTSHDDPTEANGFVTTREEALAYPTSHPNCRRTWAPRVDITSKKEARRAAPTSTQGQRAAQQTQDAARREAQRRRTLSRQRSARRDERDAVRAARQERRIRRTP
jgi:hypothetical protein